MTGPVLVGLGAGAVASFLFGSVLTGSLLAVILFYLAPLPLMLAGLAWGWKSAGLGTAAGALVAAAVLSPEVGIAFVLACGAPATWLTYLAMLSRTDDDGHTEWYPPGRLAAHSAVYAGAIAAVALLALGPDSESFRTQVGAEIEARMTPELTAEFGSPEDMTATARSIAGLILPALASVWFIIIVGNLWLAGRVLRASARLARPWPQLALIDIPRPYLATAAIMVAASLLPGSIGMVAGAAASAWMTAYLLVGLGVLHVATRGLNIRPTLLFGLYFSLVFFGLAAPIVALIGIGEPVLRLRARALAHTQGPPPPPST